jgi:lauroyl-KDO2-lipid IV(A) myristoyltransferase
MSIKDSNVDRYRFTFDLLHPRYWLTWLAMALFFIFTLLPLPVVDWLGERIGGLVAKKNRKRFNIVKVNLSLCFPEKDEVQINQMVSEHFRAQYRSLMHYGILWWRPHYVVRKRYRTYGFEKISEYQHSGKNIIILLMHSVGLEFGGAAISIDFNSATLFKPIRNAVADWKVANGRMRFGKKYGGKMFAREDGLRPLIKETRAGKVLIYLADEDLGQEKPVFAPFFGMQKATIPVLGRLAKTCDAVVLPCVSCYDPKSRRYDIHLLEPIEGLTGKDDEVDTREMNKAIEQSILYCPVQYLWTLRYFQTRPAGEQSVYE